MQIHITRNNLFKPVYLINSIIEKNSKFPILSNVLIRRSKNILEFISTDLEVQISYKIILDIFNEKNLFIEVTVSIKKLLDILRSIANNSILNIKILNNKVTILSNKSYFKLQTLPSSFFPILDKEKNNKIFLNIKKITLYNLFSMVYFSMSNQDLRYYLNGILLIFETNIIRSVATDGYRMSYYFSYTNCKINKNKKIIIPKKTVLNILRLINESKQYIKIYIFQDKIKFKFDNIDLVSKIINGKFPNFNDVIPNDYEKYIKIDRKIFLNSLIRASILTIENFKGININFKKNKIILQSSNSSKEIVKEIIKIACDTSDLNMSFNVKYFIDVLNNIKSNLIILSFKSKSSNSILITIPNDLKFKYIVMQMRI